MTFRTVPDIIRNREPTVRGRKPRSPLSKALLTNKTVFVEGKNKTWGSLYRLAHNHELRARVCQTNINGVEGYVIWFEDKDM